MSCTGTAAHFSSNVAMNFNKAFSVQIGNEVDRPRRFSLLRVLISDSEPSYRDGRVVFKILTRLVPETRFRRRDCVLRQQTFSEV